MRAYVKSGRTTQLSPWEPRAPGPGEVAVRVLANPVHPVDLETRSGKNAMLLPFSKDFVLGVDFVGEVTARGEGVQDVNVGDRVYGYRGMAQMGTFTQQLVVACSEIALAPTDMTLAEVAALPLPCLCALQALDEAGLAPGSKVLVHGGAGGVGALVTQIFADAGHEVFATANGRDEAWVHELGAARVIDYTKVRFEDIVSEVDLVFDTVGGDTLKRSFAVTRRGGTVVSLNAMPHAKALRAAGLSVPGPMAALLSAMRWPLARRARARGVDLQAQITVPHGERLARACAIAKQKGLQVRVGQTFGFEELPKAMDIAAAGGAPGRVVVLHDA